MHRFLIFSLICLISIPTISFASSITPHVITSKSGASAWLLSDETSEIVSLYLIFDAGSVYDPAGKNGLAALSARLLLEGAGQWQGREFIEEAQKHGIRFETGSSRDIIWISAQTPRLHLAKTMELLIAMLTQTEASPEALTLAQQKLLTELSFEQQSREQQAMHLWWTSVFQNHPYRFNPLGAPKDLATITSVDVKRFIYQSLTLPNLTIGMSGGITPEDAEKIVDIFATGLLTTEQSPTIQEFIINKSIPSVFLPFEGSQTSIYFGQRGIARKGRYYYHALILNHVLAGGSFSSRLMQTLREEQGLTYGVSTNLINGKYSPLLVGQVSVANDAVKQTVKTIRNVWQAVSSTGITEDELADAKSYLIGSFPLEHDGNVRIAQSFAFMQWHGLDITEWNARSEKINAITLAEINQVASALINPANLIFATVGTEQRF
jgi:zinc protease